MKSTSGSARAARFVFVSLLALALIVVVAYLYLAFFLPLPQQLTDPQSQPTTKIFDRHGELLYEVSNPDNGRKSYLRLSDMPPLFIKAILVSEDSDYYQHIGVDFGAILRAFFFNALEQKITSGASTITQQLVRNLLGTNRERNFGEKLIETAYAIRLSNHYNKDQILEQYLNTIYFGSQAYGAESAAQTFFGKSLSNLDLSELTLLAGLPQAPSRYNPYQNSAAARRRQIYVLDRLQSAGYITKLQAQEAAARPLKFRQSKIAIQAPHFVFYILNRLDAQFGEDAVNRGGLQVTTTLDLPVQQQIEQIVDYRLAQLEQKNVQSSAVLATDTSNSQVLVWIGSRDYFDDQIAGQVDLVTSLRQPGSALKPFLYLLALTKGYTAASLLPDIPQTFSTDNGAYNPQNYSLSYHGPVRFREALANSLNIPAVYLLDRIGVENFLIFLRKFGLESLNQPAEYYGLALTLGGGEVSLYELARAFQALANDGRLQDFQTILQIKTADGSLISGPASVTQPAISQALTVYPKENSFLIKDILSDDNARLLSFGEESVLDLPFPAAVKTGTTRNFKDNWAMGFSTKILVGVWVGNADASSMQNISGVDGAGPIWHDAMQILHENATPGVNFPRPPTIATTTICALSGLLPGKNCTQTIDEYFLPGTSPKQTDDFYQSYQCQENGKLETRIIPTYPPEYSRWAETENLLPPANCQPLVVNEANQATFSSKPLQILSPLPGDTFQLIPTLPAESQKIPLKLQLNENFQTLQIFVDNQLTETHISPSTGVKVIHLLLTPGKHHLEILADQQTAELEFTVQK